MPPRKTRSTRRPSRRWFLYILECRDHSLYTGVTNNLDARVKKHQAGAGARYTRSRLPVRLVYTVICADKGRALRRELAVKKLSRAEKLALVKGD